MAEYFAAPYPGAFDDRGRRRCRAAPRRGRRDPGARLTCRAARRHGRATAPAFATAGEAPLSALPGVGPARGGKTRRARPADAAGPVAAPAAAATRTAPASRAIRDLQPGVAGAGRRRGRGGRARLPLPADAARARSATTRGARWCCASSISAPRRSRSSCPARACAATARRVPGQHGLEIVHPSYRVLSTTTTARCGEAARSGVSGDRGHRPADAAPADRRRRSSACRDDAALELLPRDAGRRAATCRRCARRCSPCTARRAMPMSPRLLAGTHPAQQRLALEELLAHHLSLRRQRIALQRAWRAPRIAGERRAGATPARRACRSR